jgi:dinuclear metal center YbgI/SA1388 family protein
MARLTDVVAYLDELLEPARFSDYGPNGLQVPGREEIETIVTGVSAGAELFERAAGHDAGAVLVHHGLFWSGAPLALDRPAARRLRMLLERDCSLLAYHLPLDGHQAVGNNALLAAAIGCAAWEPFPASESPAIGVAGRVEDDGIDPAELAARVRDAVGGREPLHFSSGPERVRSVGIVSGGGSPYLSAAIEQGLDAFVTGEPIERVMLQAQEAGVHYLAAGHYATETLGVRHVGELLAQKFGLQHVFIDVPNPI